MGVVSLPSERFTRFGNPAWPGIRTANFAAFEPWSGVRQKDAESLRNSDALMRVAVPRRRGPAGLRSSIANVMTHYYFVRPSLLQTFPQYGTISSEIQSRQRGRHTVNGCEEKLRDEVCQLEADANFIELSEKCHTLNLFEILGTATTEIRHSNFLAWLLDPNGNHRLQDRFLRAFVAKLGQEDAVPKNVSDCVVRREWQHIDLLVICETEKYLLCIENKVFSHEHGNQLQRYRDLLAKEYHGYSMSFAFLTPDGISPEKENDQKIWQPVSYTDVLEAIRNARENLLLSPEVNLLLDHYTEAVMKHVTGDKNIENLCKEIYAKHKDVLDIIFENCKTSRIAACGIIDDWCKRKCENNELIYDPQFSNNTYTRFTTQIIRNLLPPLAEPISGWKSNDIAFYEIVKRENYFKITLTVCSDNMTAQQREACAKISKDLNRPDKKQNWRWKRIWNRDRHTISPDLQEDEYRSKVEKSLDTEWSAIQKFETSLINNLQ